MPDFDVEIKFRVSVPDLGAANTLIADIQNLTDDVVVEMDGGALFDTSIGAIDAEGQRQLDEEHAAAEAGEDLPYG
jgi:hypothetical protein